MVCIRKVNNIDICFGKKHKFSQRKEYEKYCPCFTRKTKELKGLKLN